MIVQLCPSAKLMRNSPLSFFLSLSFCWCMRLMQLDRLAAGCITWEQKQQEKRIARLFFMTVSSINPSHLLQHAACSRSCHEGDVFAHFPRAPRLRPFDRLFCSCWLHLEHSRLRTNPLHGYPRGPTTVPWYKLQTNAAAQPAGPWEHDGGEAAGEQLGAACAQDVPPGHAGKAHADHFWSLLFYVLNNVLLISLHY